MKEQDDNLNRGKELTSRMNRAPDGLVNMSKQKDRGLTDQIINNDLLNDHLGGSWFTGMADAVSKNKKGLLK
jgi:hypothetical protein